MTTFNINHFWEFCSHLKIDTKEFGTILLTQENLIGTQKYFVEEVAKGLNNGIHEFWCLKGRQVSITTICLALDLYWSFKHNGMSGSLVTHDEETRDMFRATLTIMMSALPKKWKIAAIQHNRTQLVLKNRSRFAYRVAGTRKNTKLGKGGALTFCHATEVSEYGDEEGMASLQASFAQTHPDRLFIYESTAQGFNQFYDQWENAKAATTICAIFIGWWRNELYRKKKGSPEYRVYWDGKLSSEEQKWTREIKKLYDFDVDDEQIAWWRWMSAEKITDELVMNQNYPPTESYAFVKPGATFFNAKKVSEEFKKSLKYEHENYKFHLRDNFEDTELSSCGVKLSNLKIWEHPKPGAYYVIGADPAWGSSDWADRFCASVWRCYGDGMDQVAEFCTADCSPYQFAWVICYLAGAYMMNSKSTCMINLELNGPGQAVWSEMLSLKRVAANSRSENAKSILSVVSNIQNFLYKRSDSFGGPSAFHTISNAKEKERMLNCFNDGWSRDMILVKSSGLLDEMKNIERVDGFLGAPGRGKDDRVITSGLATVCWIDYVRIKLVGMNITRKSVINQADKPENTLKNLSNFLKSIGANENNR